MDIKVLLFNRTYKLIQLKKLYNLFSDDTLNQSLIKNKVNDLGVLKSEFEALQEKIESHYVSADDFDEEQEINIRDEFYDMYYDIKVKYEAIMMDESSINVDGSCNVNKQVRGVKFDGVSTPKGTCACAQPRDGVNVKLPRLMPKTFSGDTAEWMSYRDLYVALIHSNSTLTDIERFSYLLTTLQGEPLNLIRALPITAANYTVAWRSLLERYDNKRKIAAKHLDDMLNLPSINLENFNGLRKMINTITESLGALKALGFDINNWDFLLLHLMLKKLDFELRRKFELESSHGRDEYPTFKEFVQFLGNQMMASEIAQNSGDTNKTKLYHVKPKSVSMMLQTNSKCCVCKGDHELSVCKIFLRQDAYRRMLAVKKNGLCFICFEPSHTVNACPSPFKCTKCDGNHNKLLHFRRDSPAQTTSEATKSEPIDEPKVTAASETRRISMSTTSDGYNGTDTLLSTAVVPVECSHGEQLVRVFIDCGSHSSFITERCCRRLGLSRRSTSVKVYGFGNSSVGYSRGVTTCTLLSRVDPHFRLSLELLVMPNIVESLPLRKLNSDSWSHIRELSLADPGFGVPAPIDMLLGADVFPSLFLGERIIGAPGEPSALQTVFGWVIMGRTMGNSSIVSCNMAATGVDESVGELLKRFWELEEPPARPMWTDEERKCEEIFVTTHSRDKTGRYCVSLPFKDDETHLGESRQLALARFYKLENRLTKNSELKMRYCEFLRDYLNSNHMELVPEASAYDSTPYYIPHHCIYKESSSSTKLRVVFDASMKSSNGRSLNDTQLIGPKLHQDIVELVLRFRLHAVVFTTDIKQMYRNILVQPQHCDYQRILWREDPSQPVCDFRLKTVTYGVASSPFLAIRTLQQLANDERERYPLAARALMKDTFMDDVVTGHSCVSEAIKLQKELIDLCAAGGFVLRKWASNSPEVLKEIPECDREVFVTLPQENSDLAIKVLGVYYDPKRDLFRYSFNLNQSSNVCTKREILSGIAKMYDPYGFIAPIVILAKSLMQKLWISGVGWDDPVPGEIQKSWTTFISDLSYLREVKLNRFVLPDPACVELHGFCDSSETGYGAVVYLRVVNKDGEISTHLLLAKSRVAPLKRVTIPRLELCGALLLAKIISYVRDVYSDHIKFSGVYAWTDSMIVLHWLRGNAYEWRTFVANRVSEIQDKLSPDRWFHVSSEDNPADCVSRGMYPSQLVEHNLWWQGPTWLKMARDSWPRSSLLCATEYDLERRECSAQAMASAVRPEWMERFSSLGKLTRVVAYCRRFRLSANKKSMRTRSGTLSVAEIRGALDAIIKVVQQDAFHDDIEAIHKNKLCSVRLQRLKPFVDERGLLRVGGRLVRSELNFDQRHPILMPKSSCVTRLLIEQYHKAYLHPGPQTLQALLHQRYWILSARSVIRQCVFKCHMCFRNKPQHVQPPMSDLPKFRVNQCRAFLKVGVDYGGPYSIKLGRLRNARCYKAYICVFVCMVTRAVHIELVSELSTNAFLASLKRFVARRGVCSEIYSDCGTNFISANKQLKEFYAVYCSSSFQDEVANGCAQLNIQWKFNPPSAPHFGGIFEAAIKSCKYHLYRTIGNQTLTYEEMNTILCQIESVLNSRPICLMSSDPSEPEVLTPGHFLIGQPLVAIPEPDVTDLPVGRLGRWHLLRQVFQHFWKRWSSEYLHTLQQRGKWTSQKGDIKVNDIVLIKDDNLPPLKWRMGVVQCLHPGADKRVRVVTVRTSNGVLKRPVVKLCPLPSSSSE